MHPTELPGSVRANEARFGGPFQHSLLAGQQHGRTIPLADVASFFLVLCLAVLCVVLRAAMRRREFIGLKPREDEMRLRTLRLDRIGRLSAPLVAAALLLGSASFVPDGKTSTKKNRPCSPRLRRRKSRRLSL
jgi:hypothetical protein